MQGNLFNDSSRSSSRRISFLPMCLCVRRTSQEVLDPEVANRGCRWQYEAKKKKETCFRHHNFSLIPARKLRTRAKKTLWLERLFQLSWFIADTEGNNKKPTCQKSQRSSSLSL
eukprot:scaffold4839_cov52-Cylindrotheca_fusiformis.AAC.1